MLYLLPNLLVENLDWKDFFPCNVKQIVKSCSYLIAESERSAYRYLCLFLEKNDKRPEIFLLNEHTREEEISDLFEKIKIKKTGALISDSGLACIADPGAKIVFLARQNKIPVTVVPGPSSIILALMLSGLSSQRFCFNGYLPRKENELSQKLKLLEKDSLINDKTHVWIETPYRTKKMLDLMLVSLKGGTFICVAQNISAKDEKIITLPCGKWKKIKDQIKKGPAVFLLKAKL